MTDCPHLDSSDDSKLLILCHQVQLVQENLVSIRDLLNCASRQMVGIISATSEGATVVRWHALQTKVYCLCKSFDYCVQVETHVLQSSAGCNSPCGFPQGMLVCIHVKLIRAHETTANQ